MSSQCSLADRHTRREISLHIKEVIKGCLLCTFSVFQERKPADVLAVMEPLELSMTSESAKERGWPRWTVDEVLNGLVEDDDHSDTDSRVNR